MAALNNIAQILDDIYPKNKAEELTARLQQLVSDYRQKISSGSYELSEKDAILITYGDQFQNGHAGQSLETLHRFYKKHLKAHINSIHFLPFFPYTSDDGFSVVDYHQIDPELGDWSDVQQLSNDARLMFDAVVNHCSKSSPWFQAYLKGEKPYDEFFIDLPKDTDTTSVTRPRALPLLHPFESHEGIKYVWTTFSEDQVDLNAGSPEALFSLVEVLLFYASQGAKLIRLDAIAFLWKELGTHCIHHPKTHRIVQLFRAIFEEVCPELVIITETNVPHEENLSYFGDGTNEAHMVYNFTLPPLLAWSLLKSNADHLRNWAKSLKLPSSQTTFFNFTASHDGIGMRPLQGILPKEEIDFLGDTSLAHGGKVSYKDNGDGTKSPYELNCNYMDFLTSPEAQLETKIQRFLCSQAVMLAMPGVPGIYVHSLLGSANDLEGMKKTGRARSINREKFQIDELEAKLSDPEHRSSKVFQAYQKLLQLRKQQKAFHPQSASRYPDAPNDVFIIERGSGADAILCVYNFSGQDRHLRLDGNHVDLISQTPNSSLLQLKPWQYAWLKKA